MAARQDIPALNGLRGVTAWLIVLYHFKDVLPSNGPFMAVVNHAALGVDLFFVMSGFILAMCYGDTFRDGVSWPGYGRFVGIRLARVYPLHVTVLVLYLSVPLAFVLTGRSIPALFSADYFVESVLLVQAWGWFGHLAWNVPAWTISTELVFYLLFPFIACVAVRLGRSWPWLGTVALLLLAAITVGGLQVGGLTEQSAHYALWRCLSECILGMGVFLAYRLVPASSMLLLAVSAALCVPYAAGLVPDYAVLPAAFACLIWAMTDGRNPVARLLSIRMLLWLGEISYSTYLIHFLAREWTKMAVYGRVPAPAALAVYLLLVFASSVVLFYTVETSGRRAGRRLTERLFARPIPVPQGLPARST